MNPPTGEELAGDLGHLRRKGGKGVEHDPLALLPAHLPFP